MLPKIIDFIDGKVSLTTHCYTLDFINCLIEEYPKDKVKLVSYLFYMTYPGSDNPYVNITDNDRQIHVAKDLGLTISLDDSKIDYAIERLRELYVTRTARTYKALCNAMEKLEDYFFEITISDGKDGNVDTVIKAVEKFGNVRESFKKVEKDFEEEDKVKTWGDKSIAYDNR